MIENDTFPLCLFVIIRRREQLFSFWINMWCVIFATPTITVCVIFSYNLPYNTMYVNSIRRIRSLLLRFPTVIQNFFKNYTRHSISKKNIFHYLLKHKEIRSTACKLCMNHCKDFVSAFFHIDQWYKKIPPTPKIASPLSHSASLHQDQPGQKTQTPHDLNARGSKL